MMRQMCPECAERSRACSRCVDVPFIEQLEEQRRRANKTALTFTVILGGVAILCVLGWFLWWKPSD